ncbi:MAG: PKD domain-containing protein, partial [Bacteroidota bacterium]
VTRGTLLYTFTATADMSAPGAHDVSAYTTFPLDSIFDNDSTSRDLTHQGLVNTFPYLEDFEGTNVWDADGAFNDWERGTPAKAVINTAFSGSNAWVTGGLTGQYSNEADNWVQSPCFDMTSVTNPWVASRVWWESEFSWDGVVLEYTTDGGLNWTEIGQFGDPNNWYTDTTINGLVTAGNSGHGWTGRTVSNNGSNGWVAAKHEIGALSGAGNVQFRMHFGSDFSVQDEGFAFDNFAIGTPPTVDLGPDSLVCDSMMINSGFTSGEFAWSTGDSTPTIWASSTGMYMLTYTDSLGLCAVDTIEVTVNPTPAVDMGGDQNICVGDSHCISIDVNTYPNLNWTGGATGGNYCINTAGGWTVMAMDSAGCPSVDSINTVMVPLPTPNLGPDTVLCQGDVLCLDPGCDSLQNTFIWSNGATSPVNCVNIISGYWVACIDSNGCEGRDSLFLTAGPAIPVSAAAFDTSNCPVVVFTESSTGTVSSYSWDFGDNNTSTSQNPTHSYAQAGNGTYNVTFIATNACGADTTNLTVDINCLVGIDDFFNSKLYVWPNPNNGAFRVETTLPGTVPVQLEIVNMQGQVVYRRDYEDAAGTFAEEVDLGEKASGVYFVRFMVDGHVKVEKIVVE